MTMETRGDSETVLRRDHIAALFDAYRDGFDDFDAETIVDCFAFPVTIWQFGKGNVFNEPDDLLENIDALLDVLGREEIASSDYEIKNCEIAGSTAFATIDWTQSRADGEEAWRFTCHYTLLSDAQQLPAIAMIFNV
ncbi:hypothetical protein [Notoacmeibacter sp. MSK16QG-6]|uniref:hypothetical protein n=1 Tax=Notoacmeibacter sp. MSK16QG-6 TaxID=2957982 RepID=UPI00209F84F3|nr:hypothetical protein [Notoacmeibacter sp. MSK16QG-6]MCP1198551.1 hypothetical protein [Notoacmeibacter sp. MSK16QG-6]